MWEPMAHDLVEQALAALRSIASPDHVARETSTAADDIESAWRRSPRVAGLDGDLAAGTHMLTFRVTDQRRSPTGYNLTGWVNVTWGYFRDGTRVGQLATRRVGGFRDVQASFRTGGSWTFEFTVPEGPGAP